MSEKKESKPPRPVCGAETREKILDAAEALFAEHGFEGASMRMITARAGVNLAAVNYHFGSKENLLREDYCQSEQSYYCKYCRICFGPS